MWFLGLRNVYLPKWTVQQNLEHNALNLLIVLTGRVRKRSLGHPYYSSHEAVNGEKNPDKIVLAKNLACLLEESSNYTLEEKKPKSRIALKRVSEIRIKRRLTEQFVNGKYCNILHKVIANPKTLKDAYESIIANSNIDHEMKCEDIPFESMANELSCGNFDVNSNVFCISTKGLKKEVLVLPNLKLKIIQEAIRISLDIIYRPQFFKTSHGCRSGRGHFSALKYVKEISNPNWWFTLVANKKLDSFILTKIISTLESRIEDPSLHNIIKNMFDADVINLEFGGFSKGQGLPQEGVLSPILMNIYLDLFDREVYRISMRYEALDSINKNETHGSHSKLRSWFRRQMNGPRDPRNIVTDNSGVRVHMCRFMDEIFFAISGSREMANNFKCEIQSYLMNSLYLDVDEKTEIFDCNIKTGVRFLGKLVKRSVRDSPQVKAVHKLKEKVELFASQKQESWNAGTVKIGKKWLSHGLKKVNESGIKDLADSSSVLSQISRFRKFGMKADHWYKVLVKIFMQEINTKSVKTDEHILSKYIAEPALPEELRDSFDKFQKSVEKYVSSETSAILFLMPNQSKISESLSVTEICVPVSVIKKRLTRYGLTNAKGIPHTCHLLILQDTDDIIDWFSGLIYRWLRWYNDCNNFSEVKNIICHQVRKSCVRTLAAKYRIHESEIERRFDSELSKIPSMDEIESDVAVNETNNEDVAMMYGICYSGLCLLSLARVVSSSRPCTCFVTGCVSAAPCVYNLHVMERQTFPSWKTGFSTCIHPSLNGRRIGLCKKHLKDLYLGHISLQSIDFGAWK